MPFHQVEIKKRQKILAAVFTALCAWKFFSSMHSFTNVRTFHHVQLIHSICLSPTGKQNKICVINKTAAKSRTRRIIQLFLLLLHLCDHYAFPGTPPRCRYCSRTDHYSDDTGSILISASSKFLSPSFRL